MIIPHLQGHLFHVDEPQLLVARPEVFAEEEKPGEPITKAAGIFALRLARVRKFNVSTMQSSPGDVKSRADSESA